MTARQDGAIAESTIRRVYRAALTAALDERRAALLSPFDPRLSAQIPIASRTSDQLLVDLQFLANLPPLEEGPHPLESWLKTAILLVEPLPIAVVFRDVLAELSASLQADATQAHTYTSFPDLPSLPRKKSRRDTPAEDLRVRVSAWVWAVPFVGAISVGAYLLLGASGSYRGQVYDERTKAPLAGVIVNLQGTECSAETAENGLFEIKCSPLETLFLRRPRLALKPPQMKQWCHNVELQSHRERMLIYLFGQEDNCKATANIATDPEPPVVILQPDPSPVPEASVESAQLTTPRVEGAALITDRKKSFAKRAFERAEREDAAGNCSEALKYYGMANDTVPGSVPKWRMAKCYEKTGDLTGAKQAYADLIKGADPSKDQGAIYESKKRLAELETSPGASSADSGNTTPIPSSTDRDAGQ